MSQWPAWKELPGPRRAEYETWLRKRHGSRALIFVRDSESAAMKEIAAACNRRARLTPEDLARWGLKADGYPCAS